jgi:hypothetical protein
MDFDFKTYMAECAVRLRSIGHSSTVPKFFVVTSIANLESLLAQLSTAGFPAIVIHDNQDGYFGDISNSQNYLDYPDYTFYVIDKVQKVNDTDGTEAAKLSCKNIGFKIIARMLKHKREAMYTGNDAYGLMLFEKRNIAYQTIGPIGNNCYGVMFFITVPREADVTYDEDDWSE